MLLSNTNIRLVALLTCLSELVAYRKCISQSRILTLNLINNNILQITVQSIGNNQVLELASSMRICCITNLNVELIETSGILVSSMPSSSLLVRVLDCSCRSAIYLRYIPYKLNIDILQLNSCSILRSELNPSLNLCLLLSDEVLVSITTSNVPCQDVGLVTFCICSRVLDSTVSRIISNELTVSVNLVLVSNITSSIELVSTLELALAHIQVTKYLVLNLLPCCLVIQNVISRASYSVSLI